MAYVLVTATGSTIRGLGSRERDAVAIGAMWADQVDREDGATFPGLPASGGRVRRVAIAVPSPSSRLSAADWQRRLRTATLAAIAEAKAIADSRGAIGLLLGHGEATPSNAWVDLAPDRAMRVGMTELVRVLAAREDATQADDTTRFIEEVGAIARRPPRLRQIDLYACAVGRTHRGEDLLSGLISLWGVRVRGLRGMLELSGNPLNSGLSAEARVLWQGAGQARGRFGEVFRDRLIEGEGLWSDPRVARRPAL